MATLKVNRSDLFPVGTSVGAYLTQRSRQHQSKPVGAAAETKTVAADGSLSFTTLIEGRRYMLWALVEGEHRYLMVEGVQSASVPLTTEGQSAPAQTTLLGRVSQRRLLMGAGVGVGIPSGADI